MKSTTHIPQEEFELIEQYILKQMPPEAYNAFTGRLENDNELQEKVHTVKLMLTGIQEAVLTPQVSSFHREVAGPVIKKFTAKQWLAAASVVLLAGLGLVLFFSRNVKEEKLFARYYHPDPGLVTAMGVSENYQFDHAMIDYKTKNYDKAIASWKQMEAASPQNDTLHYFIGSAFLAKNLPDSAITYLRKVIADTSSVFLNDAYWYLGLAFLKEKNTAEAIRFLEQARYDDKEALLSALKKIK